MSCCSGPHIPLGKTLYETVLTMEESKANVIQVFLGNPIQYKIRNFDEKDLQRTGGYLRFHNKKLYAHAPYVINLASLDEDMVAKGKQALQTILDTLAKVDPERTGTVLHIGAKGTLQNVINNINDLHISSPLFLENCAESCKFGKNMNELWQLREGIHSSSVGFCLDTCHCHSSKLCNMTNSESVVRMFEDLQSKQTVVHLNDSKTDYGSGLDRHAVVGFGKIWNYHQGESFESLISLRDYCKDHSFDIILETPSENIQSYELNILQR